MYRFKNIAGGLSPGSLPLPTDGGGRGCNPVVFSSRLVVSSASFTHTYIRFLNLYTQLTDKLSSPAALQLQECIVRCNNQQIRVGAGACCYCNAVPLQKINWFVKQLVIMMKCCSPSLQLCSLFRQFLSLNLSSDQPANIINLPQTSANTSSLQTVRLRFVIHTHLLYICTQTHACLFLCSCRRLPAATARLRAIQRHELHPTNSNRPRCLIATYLPKRSDPVSSAATIESIISPWKVGLKAKRVEGHLQTFFRACLSLNKCHISRVWYINTF